MHVCLLKDLVDWMILLLKLKYSVSIIKTLTFNQWKLTTCKGKIVVQHKCNSMTVIIVVMVNALLVGAVVSVVMWQKTVFQDNQTIRSTIVHMRVVMVALRV